jgi:hypothetical protein
VKRWIRAPVVACTAVLLPHDAGAARYPDLVTASCEFRGKAAGAFAQLLQFPADKPATMSLELSVFDELSALPHRDAELRDERGGLPSNLHWRVSERLRVTATWEPQTAALRIEGPVRNLATAAPQPQGPVWQISSPTFSETEVDRLPGWKPLVLALRPLKASPGRGVVKEERLMEAVLDGQEHARLSLLRMNLWDDESRPVEKLALLLVFGPPVGSSASSCRVPPP